ncbi:hypothetical protein HY310_02120 [Candidatus Microgenomates bacterium]|nr:hypothetical protein [Candidatus Microgenomates bacterium]
MGFLIGGAAVLLKYIPHISRKITALVFGLVFVVLLLLPSRGDFLNGWNLRMQLNNIAIEQLLKSPIIGTGLGTSPLYPRNISNFAMLHQPIHNIYLLLLSETGVLGLLGFVFIIKKRFSLFLLPILFISFFDHYWLTIQQTQLFLVIILGWLPYQKKSQ